MAEEKKELTGKEPPVKIENSIIGTTYAQIVGVVVNDVDITLEFVYVNPRPPIEKGNVIARITLPRGTGEGLSKLITETLKEHEEKKAKKEKENA